MAISGSSLVYPCGSMKSMNLGAKPWLQIATMWISHGNSLQDSNFPWNFPWKVPRNVNFPWNFPSKRTYTEVFQDFPWKVPRNLSGQSWAHPLVNYSLELQRLVRNQQNPIISQVSCLILVIKCTILVKYPTCLVVTASTSTHICWVCWVSQPVSADTPMEYPL